MEAAAEPCPLCGNAAPARQHATDDREYWRCDACALVFLARARRLSYDAEVARYELHRNSTEDAGYLKFLSRLAEPMIARVPPGARGLDYGCGQAPALGLLLSRAGRPTESYDPVFCPEESLLSRQYDFVTCSEVFEHVHEPMRLLERLGTLVSPGGRIGVMTSFRDAGVPFGEWWYIRDPTHVCFYNGETMAWIARHFGWTLELAAPNVAIFTVGASA